MPTNARSNRSADRRAALWLASIIGGVAAVSVGACHDFQACYDAQCEAIGGDGSGGTADSAAPGGAAPGGDSGASGRAGAPAGGESGAGGQGLEPFACTAPLADCDESQLTGCETNLLSAVVHCGACRARCYGVCLEGVCQPFDMLSLDISVPSTGGIVRVEDNVYVVSPEDSQLLRWSESGSEVLESEAWQFDALFRGPDRLYLLGGSDAQLSSIPFLGDQLRSEKVTATTGTFLGDTLYAVDAQGMPFKRTSSPQVRSNLPLPVTVPEGATAMLSSDGDDVVLTMSDEGDPSRYFAFYLAGSSWQLAHEGEGGHVTQVRVAEQTMYLAVALDTDEGDPEYEITRLPFGGEPEVLARTTGVTSFELTEQLYVSRESGYRRGGLLIIPLDDPSQAQELETASDMLSLTYVSPYFYFGFSWRSAFARVRNWLE